MKNYYQRQIDLLYNMIHSEHILVCSQCGTLERKYFSNTDDAAYDFYNDGWRTVDKYVYCPTCAKDNDIL